MDERMENWLVLLMLAEYRHRDLLYQVERWRWARRCREPFWARVKGCVAALLAVSLAPFLIWQMA
jgi:hypothetical protein